MDLEFEKILSVLPVLSISRNLYKEETVEPDKYSFDISKSLVAFACTMLTTMK